MSQNDHFLAHLASQACPHCGQSRRWEFEAMLRMRVNVSAGHDIAAPEWEASGSAFLQNLYQISCGGCHEVTWTRDDAIEGCPTCETPGRIRNALDEPSRVPMPERCSCGSGHLRTRAELRTIVRVENGRASAPQPLAAPGAPGYHVADVRCLACGREVVADPRACASCGSDPDGRALQQAR